jgi:hypothetical protein
MNSDWLGWIATAIFAGSYLCKSQTALRRTQGFAAMVWAAYGAIIHATPILVANLLVAGMAVYSSFPAPKRGGTAPPPSGRAGASTVEGLPNSSSGS